MVGVGQRADAAAVIERRRRRLLKFGVKYRDKSKGRDRNEITYTTPSTLKMTDYPRDRLRPAAVSSTAATT